MKFSGKKALIVGYGLEGKGSLDFLLKEGAKVSVYDRKESGEFEPEVLAYLNENNVQTHFSSDPGRSYDLAVRSPGVPFSNEILKNLKNSGVEITSATKIFFDSIDAKKVIGVTGTKGKGTTSSLIVEILRAGGRKVLLGGNIGTPMLTLLGEIDAETIVVLELSSFQLEDLHKSPHIAVVLMATEDHLDYHQTVEEYLKAKSAIAKFQIESDFLVFNVDYPGSLSIAAQSPAQKFGVSKESTLQKGAYIDAGDLVISAEGIAMTLLPIEDIQIPGEHNLENAAAAAMASYLAAVPIPEIQKGLRSFRGLEHRLEFVAEVAGVAYYNDSFSTNPSSTIAAIKAFDSNQVLILGGSSKGSDFSELAKIVAQKDPRLVIGIGDEWQKIKEQILKLDPGLNVADGFKSMQDAVKAAATAAQPGDVVILSPACASFGMFKDYKERGRLFKEAVLELTAVRL